LPPCMHVHVLGSETSFDLFFAASSRSNTKVSIGTDEREGSYTSTCQEPPAGKSASLLFYQHVNMSIHSKHFH
jgi:hypothetical protein